MYAVMALQCSVHQWHNVYGVNTVIMSRGRSPAVNKELDWKVKESQDQVERSVGISQSKCRTPYSPLPVGLRDPSVGPAHNAQASATQPNKLGPSSDGSLSFHTLATSSFLPLPLFFQYPPLLCLCARG